MITNKVILRLSKAPDTLAPGVLECWSIGVLKKNIEPLAITPILQYSNTPKPIQIEYAHDR
jgi:hypothetical protein